MAESSEERIIEADGREVAISHPDKVLFSDSSSGSRTDSGGGITKYDLAEYYSKVSDVALRHFRGRPLTMHRYPDGIDGSDFFQKNIADYFPDWIDRATLPKEDGEVTHVVADNAATLERRFRGKGTSPGTVLVARLARGHRAYLVEEAS